MSLNQLAFSLPSSLHLFAGVCLPTHGRPLLAEPGHRPQECLAKYRHFIGNDSLLFVGGLLLPALVEEEVLSFRGREGAER